MRDPCHALNADLHCHSVVSDGTLAPAALVDLAHANGVALFALTDHDETAGIAEASARAAQLGLPFVAGVEVSVTWASETVHVVGLRVDPKDPALVAGLARTRAGRTERAREIGHELEQVGIPGAFEGALRHARNPDLVSRSHFARYIVESGHCASVGEVFGRYLIAGKPGYVPHRWATLEDALSWIRGAGGVPVLAHPGRYDLGEIAFECMLDAFVEHGGTAIEVVCGSHAPAE
jgi:3',5'-nucleoside bisphosphate phosphatase